jgi:methylase of polypeptide subunit release factors
MFKKFIYKFHKPITHMTSFTTEEQKEWDKLSEFYTFDTYTVDIQLDETNILEKFVIHPKVLRPEVMNALHLAQWLFSHSSLYIGKKVIDMGSGSGIQGIVMGLYGAMYVTFTDLSPASVENTKENIQKFQLKEKSKVLQGDLFERIDDKADLIVFNHPFFSDHTVEQLIEAPEKIERGKLIHRFFEDAKQYLAPEGVIVMPYFHAAGPENDPLVQAPQHGYEVVERLAVDIKTGLQQGMSSVYEIRLKIK